MRLSRQSAQQAMLIVGKTREMVSSPLIFLTTFAMLSSSLILRTIHIDAKPTPPSNPSLETRYAIENCLQDVTDCMKRHEKCNARRPFVTLAYAQSLDGRIAILSNGNETINTSSNFAISSFESLLLTHALRSVHDAIMVGGKTLAIDNPRLTNRLWLATDYAVSLPAHHQPRPIVLDPFLKHVQALGNSCNAKNLIVCCSQDVAATMEENAVKHEGIILLKCRTTENGQLDLHDVLQQLKVGCGIQSVMVEGGAAVLTSFISEQLVDLQCVTISNKLLGSKGLSSIGNLGTERDYTNIGPLKCITLGPDCAVFSQWQRKD